jgi:predicted dehydrogenase
LIVKVFQVGLGSFGKYGLEKFVDMEEDLEEVDVRFEGLCDVDPEKREKAGEFKSHEEDFDIFGDLDRMYEAAEASDGENVKVLIYDAGPSELHAEHIEKSLRKNFFHLAEKPPSMTREEHLEEKKMMLDRDVRFTVDFVERESPVVKKAQEILDGEEIDSIKVFRESSAGIDKLIEDERKGVEGGPVLDKMVHEAYILDLMDAEMEVQEVRKNYFLPFNREYSNFMDIFLEETNGIDEDTIPGICNAEMSRIELHASWVGASEEAEKQAQIIEEKTGHNPIEKGKVEKGGEKLLEEESRFFIIEGDRKLFGDMLEQKLFDLGTGRRIQKEEEEHDQLYRVLKSSVKAAAGLENHELTEKQIESFMNAVFDISEHIGEYDEEEMVERSRRRIEGRIED